MKRKSAITFIATVVINIGILCSALFVDEIRKINILLLIGIVFLFAVIQVFAGDTFDYIRQVRENQKLIDEKERLLLNGAETREKLTELQEVLVSFLENSDIYRERIKEKLKINEDYICLIKSSEGLTDVFSARENKEMLPFASVIMKISGSIRPFERMGIFLIPIRSLPGINEWNLRKYINTNIIPLVEIERKAFLARSGKIAGKLADEFSYKYIAFILRKGTIAYDAKNRKFNHEFTSFLIQEQSTDQIKVLKDELSKVVKVKDILSIVNWSSFTKLNRDQKVIVGKKQKVMSDALSRSGVETLSQVSVLKPEELTKIIWPILKGQLTKKKVNNLSHKIIEGTYFTVSTLRNNGISI